MIEIKDVEILDMLPYTFKTNKYKALSAAIKALTALFYSVMSSVMFWADIENASPALLDAMAAELDAPFYSADMTIEQKRSVVAAAFEYNSRIGTRSSVEALLTAAFGGGEVSEWFEYDGEPYHFKVTVPRREGVRIEHDTLNYFIANVEKFKNKRSKLEGVEINTESSATLYLGAATVIEMAAVMPSVDYATYNDIKDNTYTQLQEKTYREILYKEE